MCQALILPKENVFEKRCMLTEYYLARIEIVQLKTQKKSIFDKFFKKNAKNIQKSLRGLGKHRNFVTRNLKKRIVPP